MANRQLQNLQVASMRESFFQQGYLDEQFIQLEELEDAANPNFVEEVVTLFFRDSIRQLNNIDQALRSKPLDFATLDGHMHQFKGSSSSIGALKVKDKCTLFRDYCKEGNAEGVKKAFGEVKNEMATLKRKLEAYFQVMRQVGPAETAVRPQ